MCDCTTTTFGWVTEDMRGHLDLSFDEKAPRPASSVTVRRVWCLECMGVTQDGMFALLGTPQQKAAKKRKAETQVQPAKSAKRVNLGRQE